MDCHRCGRDAPSEPGRRLGFREECPGCGADLHVCRNCAHHQPGAYNDCRESAADRVLDKERANRCDQFAPATVGGLGAAEASDRARAELERLFKK